MAIQVMRQEQASTETATDSGEGMMAWGGSLKTGAKLAVQAVIGGTLSELGGGNFANGAVTAAFAFLFNDLAHKMSEQSDKDLQKQLEMAEYAFSLVGTDLPYPGYPCNYELRDILMANGMYPEGRVLTAKEWADPTKKRIGNWEIVTDGTFQNGDVAAYRYNYKDATGHCGIIYNAYDRNGNTTPFLIYSSVGHSHTVVSFKDLML